MHYGGRHQQAAYLPIRPQPSPWLRCQVRSPGRCRNLSEALCILNSDEIVLMHFRLHHFPTYAVDNRRGDWGVVSE